MEPNEAMKAMARRVADELIPNPENESVVYKSFHQTAERAALAAIMETQEACARLAEGELVEVYGDSPEIDTECNHLVRRIATAIRTGEHYALAGDRHA